MNPEPFLNLDRVIHEKGRLAIMSALAAAPRMPYRDLRDLLVMTDGNVTAHIRTLHDAGYVSVIKEMERGRSLTCYALTASGRQAFTRYIALLEQIVAQSKPPSNPS